jgi:hypothetical protein
MMNAQMRQIHPRFQWGTCQEVGVMFFMTAMCAL